MENNIKDLFKKWKQSHIDEKNPENTLPKTGNFILPVYFKNSFFEDGSLSSSELNENKILFICKESNVYSQDNLSEKYDNYFWMKEVVDEKLSGKNYYNEKNKLSASDKRARTKYFNCLDLIARAILKENYKRDILYSCAYMNLNKRGGFSKTNSVQLKNYIEKYREFILNETELLNPQNIVFTGRTDCIAIGKMDLKSVFKEAFPNINIWILNRHPCRYRRNGDEILDFERYN